MALSRKPSVWIERRKTATGYVSFRVRLERDGVRFPMLACGPARANAVKVADTLKSLLWAHDKTVELLLAEWREKKVDAATFAADLRAYVLDPKNAAAAPARHRAPQAAGRTVGELVDEYLRDSRKYKAPRAVEIDEAALGRLTAALGRDRLLSTISTQTIRDLHQGMVGKPQKPGAPLTALSKTSEAMYLFAIRACFNRGRAAYKMLTHDPFDGFKIFRVGSKGRLIHQDEFAKIQPEAEKLVRAGRSLWDALDVMRHQGLRSGAVCALDGRMIDRGTWHLHLTMPARLGIARDAELKNTELYAPIHPAVRHIFKDGAEGLIFAGWNRQAIAQALRRICDRLKVPRFRPHDLKHTFVTNFLKGGGTLAMCSAITGTSMATLKKVYGHLEGRVPAAEMLRVSYSSPTPPPKYKTAGSSKGAGGRILRR